MEETQKNVVRCRAVILHDGKLLLVKHSAVSGFFALPGGHLEWGENVLECMRREVIEELGIAPEIGRLLYVHTFLDGSNCQSTEFFFEITNGRDYLNFDQNNRSHAHEIHEFVWASATDDVIIKPQMVADDFRSGTLLSDTPRFTQV